MEDSLDEFEEEYDNLEESEEEEIPKAKKKVKKKVVKSQKPVERYMAFHQPERTGILDTITEEVIVEGLSSVETAKLEAFKLNKLDKIGIVSGANN